MIQEYDIRVLPQVAANEQSLRNWIAEEKGFDVRTITYLRTLRKSIDARQRTILVNLKVRVYINEMPEDDAYQHTDYPDVSGRQQVIVVGAGPGGLFAALKLIELGRVGQVPIPMANSIHAARNEAILKRFFMCSVNMVPRRISYVMPIRI